MAIQTMDDAQGKADRRVDRSFKKKAKRVPLSSETLNDLHNRGASLAEQMEWIKLKQKQKDKDKYER
jgi:predicted nuclease with RNAse H fold